jgi:hypothetical protein
MFVSVKRKTWFEESLEADSAKSKPAAKPRLQSLEEARFMHKMSKAQKNKLQLPTKIDTPKPKQDSLSKKTKMSNSFS